MNITRFVIHFVVVIVAATAGNRPTWAGVTPAGTAFTYQGVLNSGGGPVSGTYHLRFQLWNAPAGGAQVGIDFDAPAVAISEGLFTTQLDFGADAFDGSARWLQVQVVTSGGAIVTTLAPRQPITATPYALQTRGIVVDANNNVGIGTAVPQDDMHVASNLAILRLQDTTTPGGFTQIYDAQPTQLRFSKTNLNGQVLFDLNPKPANGASNASVRLFRETNTTGEKGLWLHRGNNTNSTSAFIGVDGANSFFQAHGGNVGIGTTTPMNPLRVESDDPTQSTIHAENPSSLGLLGSVNTGVAGSSLTGVRGTTQSIGVLAKGVHGRSLATSSFSYAVYGEADSPTGYDFYAGGAGVNYGQPSSIRWKRNVEVIDDALWKLAQLRGVYFDWDGEHGGHHDVGMIAEEVGAVLPEIVTFEANGIDARGMDYSKLTPLLVEAVKALRAEKDGELAALAAKKDSQISALTAQVDSLSARLAALESVIQHFSKE